MLVYVLLPKFWKRPPGLPLQQPLVEGQVVTMGGDGGGGAMIHGGGGDGEGGGGGFAHIGSGGGHGGGGGDGDARTTFGYRSAHDWQNAGPVTVTE